MHIGIHDISVVLKRIVDVAPNWEPIGSLLGIHGDTLTAISNDNSASADKCLIDMVTCWLQHNYDTSRHGLPTWERLVQVIASPAGGNNATLALTIAQQYNVSVQHNTMCLYNNQYTWCKLIMPHSSHSHILHFCLILIKILVSHHHQCINTLMTMS